MLYEGGFIRYIKRGGVEVIRMINHLVRDKNWATVPMEISSEQIERTSNSFSILYKAQCIRDEIQFQWNCSVIGREDETLLFMITGQALHSFMRNRIGFTVLHPIETTAGRPCIITHGNEESEEFHFPQLISPHQPFFDIKAMRWNPAPGLAAALNFDGDIFETEDQRNWLDASFKTYCTPVSKPFPHQVIKGDEVQQTIHLKVYGDLKNQSDAVNKELSFSLEKNALTELPLIGFPLSDLAHEDKSISMIRQLNADFIRISFGRGRKATKEYIERAVSFGQPLEVVVFVSKENDLGFLSVLEPYANLILQFILLPDYANATGEALLQQIVPALRKSFPRARIGGGTDAFFTELNRDRTPSELLDFVTFSINPQAHAPDIKTMTENLSTHRDVVISCRAFAGKDIHVGPVTFRMRWNPSATGPEVEEEGSVPKDVDPRMLSLYGAAWTVGSVKYLAENGVKAATYYETCGWRGLMSHPEQPWPLAYGLPSQPYVYPLYLIFSELLKYKNHKVARLTSTDPLRFDGLAFVDMAGIETIFLVNMTSEEFTVAMPDDTQYRKIFTFDSSNIEPLLVNGESLKYSSEVIHKRVALRAFAVVIVRSS